MQRDISRSAGRDRAGYLVRRALSIAAVLILVAACAETEFVVHTAKRVGRTGEEGGPTEGIYKVGNPYQISGVWYYPAEDYEYDETGIASWYGPGFHEKPTANGDRYDMNALTAAHRTLPMPSLVRVVNLDNGRSIVLKVNDRGPFAHGRIIDVSRRAAQLLGFESAGTARVRVQILPAESRAIAARMQGRQIVAANDTPITVDRIPKPTVDSASLPPPPGAASVPSQQVASLPEPPPTYGEPAEAGAPEEAVGQLEFGRPDPGQIYIQAGAFAYFDNANRVRAQLSGVGPVQVSPVLVSGRDLFRVRLGPIASVHEADLMLEQVIGSGYSDARIIVD